VGSGTLLGPEETGLIVGVCFCSLGWLRGREWVSGVGGCFLGCGLSAGSALVWGGSVGVLVVF
jgi:hypothetical protein